MDENYLHQLVSLRVIRDDQKAVNVDKGSDNGPTNVLHQPYDRHEEQKDLADAETGQQARCCCDHVRQQEEAVGHDEEPVGQSDEGRE